MDCCKGQSGAYQMKRILITGTGRSGTTLLVQILTALGFDTGYTLDEALNNVDPIARAGLEPNLRKEELAQVVKAPGQAEHIERLLQTEWFQLEAAILPVRELFAAAESRRNVFRLAMAAGKNPFKQPGSLWETENPTEQEARLAIQFYRCFQPIVASRAPLHLIDFPGFVREEGYLYQSLRPIFEIRAISESDVASALRLVAKPELINDFDSPTSQSVPTSYGRNKWNWRISRLLETPSR